MNSEIDKVYDLREYRPSDASFILATFLLGVYYGDSAEYPYIRLIPKNIFMEAYKKIGTTLLDSPKVVINVACLKEDPDVILGYSILSSDFSTIHWVFVKSAWRKQGLARALLPKYPTAATHMTVIGTKLMNKFENLIFNPFLL